MTENASSTPEQKLRYAAHERRDLDMPPLTPFKSSRLTDRELAEHTYWLLYELSQGRDLAAADDDHGDSEPTGAQIATYIHAYNAEKAKIGRGIAMPGQKERAGLRAVFAAMPVAEATFQEPEPPRQVVPVPAETLLHLHVYLEGEHPLGLEVREELTNAVKGVYGDNAFQGPSL